LEEFVTTHNEK